MGAGNLKWTKHRRRPIYYDREKEKRSSIHNNELMLFINVIVALLMYSRKSFVSVLLLYWNNNVTHRLSMIQSILSSIFFSFLYTAVNEHWKTQFSETTKTGLVSRIFKVFFFWTFLRFPFFRGWSPVFRFSGKGARIVRLQQW